MAEDHEDGPIHQAPWVAPFTVAVCIGIVCLVMFLKFMFGADLGSPM